MTPEQSEKTVCFFFLMFLRELSLCYIEKKNNPKNDTTQTDKKASFFILFLNHFLCVANIAILNKGENYEEVYNEVKKSI